MAKVDDLSCSLTPLDQSSTLICVVELSRSSWLIAGMVPGVERRPLKQIEPDAPALRDGGRPRRPVRANLQDAADRAKNGQQFANQIARRSRGLATNGIWMRSRSKSPV
jgi:hypothetical protein